jgi:hypothetical protein
MCGMMFAGGKNAKRMYKDSTPVGQVMRNADRRNAEKDKNRIATEKEEAYQADRKDKIASYEAQQKRLKGQNTGLQIPTQ